MKFDFDNLYGTGRLKLSICWKDFWIGWSYDPLRTNVQIQLFPCIGILIKLNPSKGWSTCDYCFKAPVDQWFKRANPTWLKYRDNHCRYLCEECAAKPVGKLDQK